ncbi:aminoglycoside phosphotransferase family protein [Streptomyces griseorubiginosus]|uniref:aminoglycoside phosphotransferase family protein n=1 Tax=Streptomyces griseorubiginosus TaxID=67304 RepID=UPI0027E334B6|nr:aminoglycoside phosphotransferase family protein [Streptomyces griseorubiginosus]
MRAAQLSIGRNEIEGPLRGYHHETYVFPLPDGIGLGQGRWKCREPRSNLLWFDRRCFVSEEQLLKALAGHIERIPDVFDVDSTGLQRFVEGQTLGSLYTFGEALPEPILDQIVLLFEQLVRVAPETITVERRCVEEDRPADGDTNGFLDRLIHFTEEQVYKKNRRRFGELFQDLGVDNSVFPRLRKRTVRLSGRPFCLLHADLHRENFIIDPQQQLWTIDWELAMVGDPLYDLATHLFLMQYPDEQSKWVQKLWAEVVEHIRPGSSAGMAEDLPLLMDYKRAQSVFTDVIREAMSLVSGPDIDTELAQAGWKLHEILTVAADPLDLSSVPSQEDITAALDRWRRDDSQAKG